MREDSTSGFEAMAQEAEALLDEPLQPPLMCGRQRHHNSRVTVAESAEDFYRRTVYIPFLDSIIAQFNERFLSHKNTAIRLNALLPTKQQLNLGDCLPRRVDKGAFCCHGDRSEGKKGGGY